MLNLTKKSIYCFLKIGGNRKLKEALGKDAVKFFTSKESIDFCFLSEYFDFI
ncbi:hypothetical protein N9440_07280 [Alphaproteobacteria bacterium]|nr:hypothetical protein [Alphaproteobacteria bacterium]